MHIATVYFEFRSFIIDKRVLTAVLINLFFSFLQSRYQSPIPVDQVKPWTEFDYEGGKAFFLLYLLFLLR